MTIEPASEYVDGAFCLFNTVEFSCVFACRPKLGHENVTKKVLSPCISLPSLPHISKKKKREGIRPKCKTTRTYNCVEKTAEKTTCVVKCWLNCQFASFEALLSLEKKTIDDPTPSWTAVTVLRLAATKRYPANCVVSHVLSHHIGKKHVPKKKCWWSRNKKTPWRTSLVDRCSITAFLRLAQA